jgi:MFS family permease
VVADKDRLRPLRVLRHRDFRLIAIGNMVSQLGFWGQYVAAGLTARRLTESSFLVALTFAVQFLPSLLFSSIAGAMADRNDRRKLVLFGNLAMVFPSLAIGLLIQAERISMGSLIALVFLSGVGQAFTLPATSAYVPSLVPADEVHSAIALNAGMSNSTRVIGPTLFSLLIAASGAAWGFYLNAVSFLAVTTACSVVRIRPVGATRMSGGMLNDIRIGMAYAKRNKAVARLLLFIAFNSFWMMHAALLPIFATDVLHGEAPTLGALAAAPGYGFVGAAMLTTALTTGRHKRVALVGCSLGLTVAQITLALSRDVVLSVAALALFGLCFMTLNTVVTTMLVVASEDAYRGRVMGLLATANVGAFPINSVLAGVFASLFGAPTTVFVCAVAVLVFNAVFFGSGSLAVIRSGTQQRRPAGSAS